MSEHSDDGFDQAEEEKQRRWYLSQACRCKEWHWFQNDDGLYECRECGETVDL